MDDYFYHDNYFYRSENLLLMEQAARSARLQEHYQRIQGYIAANKDQIEAEELKARKENLVETLKEKKMRKYRQQYYAKNYERIKRQARESQQRLRKPRQPRFILS